MRTWSSASALAAAIVLVIAATASGDRKPQRVTCPGGRFLAGGPLLDGAAGNEPVVIDGTLFSIGAVCPPVGGKLKPAPGKVKVKAAWKACAGLAGKVRLVGALAPDCVVLSGTVKARKASINKSFAARRSTCGDGVLDRDAGEQCDGGVSCGTGERCAPDCVCVPDDGSTTTTSTTLPAVRFSTDVQPILTATCAQVACHIGQFPGQNLDFAPRRAWSELVDVDSEQCPGVKRVAPGAPDASYLMSKLRGEGPCFLGSRMPSVPNAPLSAADMETIRAWIAQGAPNN